MMKKEDQVCTLQQAKILRELGITQDSIWYHFPNPNTDGIIKKHKLAPYIVIVGSHQLPGHVLDENIRSSVLTGYYDNTFSAFSTAELGQMLPEYIQSKLSSNSKKKKGEEWYCTMIYNHKRFPEVTEDNFLEFVAGTEAQARARMLIEGIKQGYPGFAIKEINKRLTK